MLFASILGLLIGLIEGTADVLSGSFVLSTWAPEDFQAPGSSRILYVIFSAAVYGVFFQVVGMIAAILQVLAEKGKHSDKSPRNEFFPYWALLCIVLGTVLFSNTSDMIREQVEFFPTVAMSLANVLFVGILFLQIRAFQKLDSDAGPSNHAVARRKHEARVAAYLILAVSYLILPDVSEVFGSLLMRCALLLGILAAVYPFAGLVHACLDALLPQRPEASEFSEKGKFRVLVAISTVVVFLAPACAFISLAQQPCEETISLLSSESGDSAEKRPVAERKNSPNVILILIDMLRADHVHRYGYHRETTPNFDQYADKGVLFSNARAQSSWTLPSTVSLMTGLHPSSHGVRNTSDSLSDEVDTLAENFSRNGYSTAAFISNPFLKKASNVKQGFHYYCDDLVRDTYWRAAKRNVSLFTKTVTGANATMLLFSRARYKASDTTIGANYDFENIGIARINSEAVKWVEKNSENQFFIYLHYIDVHGPYFPPRPFDENFDGNRQENKVNLYDGALRYTDSQIGSFMKKMRQLGVLDNSVVIITADHGEEFDDHGSTGHGGTLFEEQLHIPLIFLRTSAFPYNKVIDESVGLIDIVPTLVEYLGFDPPNNAQEGTSFADLFDTGDRPSAPKYQYAETEYLHLERSVIYKARWKFIYSEKPRSPSEYLFDLLNDPEEQVNLVREQPEMASKLREKLIEAFSDFESRSFTAQTAETDERTRQMLKSLGYLK